MFCFFVPSSIRIIDESRLVAVHLWLVKSSDLRVVIRAIPAVKSKVMFYYKSKHQGFTEGKNKHIHILCSLLQHRVHSTPQLIE